MQCPLIFVLVPFGYPELQRIEVGVGEDRAEVDRLPGEGAHVGVPLPRDGPVQRVAEKFIAVRQRKM